VRDCFEDSSKKLELSLVGIVYETSGFWDAMHTLWESESLSLWDKVKMTFLLGINSLFRSPTVQGAVAGALIGLLTGQPLLGAAVGGLIGFIRGRLRRHQWGGIVTRPTIALLGEAGPEVVVPLAQLSTIFRLAARAFWREVPPPQQATQLRTVLRQAARTFWREVPLPRLLPITPILLPKAPPPRVLPITPAPQTAYPTGDVFYFNNVTFYLPNVRDPEEFETWIRRKNLRATGRPIGPYATTGRR